MPVRLALTRRQFLRWTLAGGAAVALPVRGLYGCGGTVRLQETVPDFLTPAERRTLTALTGRIVPTDDLPGAVDTGAAEYINRLLTLVPTDAAPAGNVFAGGPFSDRNPFPNAATGTPSTDFPPNDFEQFIPLTRLQLMSWRVQLLGSAAVPGADFNDAVLGPVIGWRDRYRAGLAAIQETSIETLGAEFAALTPMQQDDVIKAADANFISLVTDHTLEGMFCAPEYGGNADRVGWQLLRYDGDSQPLGYSIFDETTMSYRERADKPNSTADPDEDFGGVDAEVEHFLSLLVRVVGGPHFP